MYLVAIPLAFLCPLSEYFLLLFELELIWPWIENSLWWTYFKGDGENTNHVKLGKKFNWIKEIDKEPWCATSGFILTNLFYEFICLWKQVLSRIHERLHQLYWGNIWLTKLALARHIIFIPLEYANAPELENKEEPLFCKRLLYSCHWQPTSPTSRTFVFQGNICLNIK